MRRISSIPFLRISLAFIFGIVLYSQFNSLNIYFGYAIFIICGLLSILYLYLSPSNKLKLRWLNGILLHLLLVGLGYLNTHYHQIENNPNWYRHHLKPEAKIQARISSPLKTTERTYKTKAAILNVYTDKTQQVSGDAIIYFRKDDGLPNLNIGDEILFANKLQPIFNKGNPGEFNFAKHSSNSGIYDQAFLVANEWRKINRPKSSFQPLVAGSQYIKNTIKHYIPDTSASSIALALVTGYRDDIDKEVYNNYAKTGLVHLLAISGLHMGIFFLGTKWMLGLIPMFKRKKNVLIIASLTIMWLFALLTTFPPSVQRASLMFTFIGIGQLINRRIPSVQFLFLSAFVMLLLQPHLIWEVGFQLSYTAVLGILLFYKPLRFKFYTRNKIVSSCLDIVCLTLSAQIFTFPLAIYYFHQFPTLFLFTNIVAIPLVTLIIYGEILLIILSFIPFVATYLGIALSHTIQLLNSFIQWVSTFSFVTIDGIWINEVQLFLLLLFALTLAAWFLGKRKKFAVWSSMLIASVIIIAVHRKYNLLHQQHIVIYNAPSPYIELIQAKNAYTRDTIIATQAKNFQQYVLEPSHRFFGILKTDTYQTQWVKQDGFDLITWSNQKILRIHKANRFSTRSTIAVDYLILSDKWIKDIDKLLSHISPQEIIIDGNIPLWKIDELRSQLTSVHLPIHYIGTQGAKNIRL